jgi:hypothetical protein
MILSLASMRGFRYIHAAQTQFPGASERGEPRLFAHAHDPDAKT